MAIIGLWNDEQVAEVKALFGDQSELYRLAVNGQPELVQRLSATIGEADPTVTELIEALSVEGDEARLDVRKAQALLDNLRDARRIEALLDNLQRHPPYQQYCGRRVAQERRPQSTGDRLFPQPARRRAPSAWSV